MNRIGVMAESFRLGVLGGINAAKQLGAGAVQMYVGKRGDVDKLWTPDHRRQVRDRLDEQGLKLSALCGDLGGHGFQTENEIEWRIDETRKMFALARDLGGDILTTHIGVVPEDTRHPRRKIMLDSMRTLGGYAKDEGVRIAIETGPERPEILKCFLDDIGLDSVGVNYDPANLLMVLLGVDVVKGVYTLRDHIFHTHVKDGKMLRYIGPESVYGFFAEGGIEDLRMDDYIKETALGDGDVDFKAWVKALKDIGYAGYYTIEREVGDNPSKDIEKAVDFLRAQL